MNGNNQWEYIKDTVDEKGQYNFQALTADYIRLEVKPSDEKNKKILSENQYIWVDRTIKAKIDLRRIESNFSKLIRLDVQELGSITDEVYDIAEKAFKKDRRFFLSVDYKEEIGHRVLRDYIFQQSQKNHVIFGCYYEKKMIGVLIALKLDPHTYETVLGAILPEWQTRGAGISLYAYEFDVLKKRDGRTLYSRISTDNTASLNLHLSLSQGNISFLQPLDIFLKKQEGE